MEIGAAYTPGGIAAAKRGSRFERAKPKRKRGRVQLLQTGVERSGVAATLHPRWRPVDTSTPKLVANGGYRFLQELWERGIPMTNEDAIDTLEVYLQAKQSL